MQVNNVLMRSEMSAGTMTVGGRTGGSFSIPKLTIIRPKLKNKKFLFGAAGFVTAVIAFFAFGFPQIDVVYKAKLFVEQLKEATDSQHADGVESMIIVFQEALATGDVPSETARILKDNGVTVGYIEDGTFIEGNNNKSGLVLKIGDKIVESKDFVSEIHNNVYLYNAFDIATYSGVAYYYNKSATEIISKYSSRNNFKDYSNTKTAEENYSAFTETMNKIVKGGSDGGISINGVSVIQNEEGEEYQYVESGTAADSKSGAGGFLSTLANVITGENKESATINCASVADIADTLSMNDYSKRFSLGLMEPFSKVLVGEISDSYVYEAISYLFEEKTSQVFDTETQTTVEITGSAIESPSVYAILTGDEMNPKDRELAENFASGRILKLAENRTGLMSAYDSIINNVASLSTNNKSTIGRLNTGSETCDINTLNLLEPIISSSQNRSIESLEGIPAGEVLVNGLKNLGNELAKENGAAAGDEEAVTKYNKLTKKILAMDAEIDRMNRSPFDITSKNTFLGSIVYNMATTWGGSGSSIFAKGMTLVSTTNNSIASIFPSVNADSDTGFSSIFGTCETLSTTGAVGSIHCAESSTFDTSTLDDPLNNPDMLAFKENNLTIDSSGNYAVKEGSDLENYLRNILKGTPLGVVDGGILDSLKSKASSIPFISSIVNLVKSFVDANPADKLIASGAAFVNSSNNPLWGTVYKWAQRYIALINARDTLRWAAGDENAYNNIPLLEGTQNPIADYLNKHVRLAEK